MKLCMLSWDVRGLHDLNKRRVINSFVRRKKPNLICFQGTKICSMTVG